VADPATLDLAGLTAEAGRLGYERIGQSPGTVVWTTAARGDERPVLADYAQVTARRWQDDSGSHRGQTEAAALRWLLATPEARRLAAIVDAAKARGREQGALLRAVVERALDEHRDAEIAAAEARGRDAERAAVVAWLRAAVAAYRGTHAEDALADTLRDVMAGEHARGGE